MARVVLVNPQLPARPRGSSGGFLDQILAIEKGVIDSHLFRTFAKPHYTSLGIQKTFHEHSSNTASLGLLSMAAVLQKDGHHVVYYEDKGEFTDEFKNHVMNADVVGVTGICTNWQRANDISKQVKILNPKVLTIIGGPHATYSPNNPLLDNPALDCVCKGYGEEVLRRVAQDPFNKENLHTIPGLDVREEGAIRLGSPPMPVDMRSLPPPLYSLVRDPNTQIYLQFSRGCERSCGFCCEWEREQHKSAIGIQEDLEALEKVKQRNLVFIVDSNFFGSQEKLAFFREAVVGTTNFFTVQTRITTLDANVERYCQEMKVANQFIGIENLSDEVLAAVGKGYTWSDIQRVLAQVGRAAKLPLYRTNFIQGLPGETTEEANVNLVRRKKIMSEGLIVYVNDSLFVPTPGSPIFCHPERYNIRLKKGFTVTARNEFPQYEYVGHNRRTPLEIFLHHLDMRRLCNEQLMQRYNLEWVRDRTMELLNKGEPIPDSLDLYRC